MPDIMMCDNVACKRRNKCYRYLAYPSEYRQAYGVLNEETCDVFWHHSGRSDIRTVDEVDALYRYRNNEEEDDEDLSPCCGAEIIHHDLCSECKEHV